ncbi:MAG: hypothetical protein K5883_10005, partial [Pseudobutyrivibrio sp.]|nr:hypothetical protein [Pseudobutyrivibrio sp.]
MSNFEDYDLRRGSGAGRSGRPTGRPTGRPSGRPSTGRPASRSYNRDEDLSPDLYMNDESDLYDYDLGSEYMDSSRSRSTSARRPSSSVAGTARRKSSSSSAHRSPSHSVSRSHSSARPSSGRSSAARPALAGNKRVPSKSARPTSRPSSSRRGNNRKAKKKSARRTILVVEIVLIVVLVIGLFLWNKIGKVNWDNNIKMDKMEVNNLDTETEELLTNYTTLALFGVDNRSNGNLDSGNSDSIILVSIN